MIKLTHIAAVAAALGCVPSAAQAQTFPTGQMRIVVAFAVGGPADIISRAVAPALAARLGKQVIVENRPGANGKLAIQTLLKAKRDGHTLAYISSSIVSIGSLNDKETAELVKEIVPLTTAFRTSNVLAVHPSLKVKTVAELVAYAKANPGKLFYGSIGQGSWYHFAMERILLGLEIEATHVAYKGEAPAVQELASGNIQMMIVSAAGKGLFESGRIIALASVGGTPAIFVPNAPPLRESGIARLATHSDVPWVGFGTATGVPDDVIAKLHEALVEALKSDDVRKRISMFGVTETSTIAELRKTIADETASNRALVESGRIKLGSQ